MSQMILDNALALLINERLLALGFGALFILFIAALKEKSASSGLFALLTAVVISAVGHGYALHLLESDIPYSDDVVRFAWYIGFASFDMLGLYAIQTSNEMQNVHAGRVSRLVALVFFTRGIITLLRYAERTVWDTNHLQALYKTGIVAINVTSAITCFCLAVAYCIGVFQLRRGKRKKMWDI